MPNKIEAYKCNFCRKVYIRKSDATNHENNYCNKSSIARRCKGCANLNCSSSIISCDKNYIMHLEEINDGFEDRMPHYIKLWKKHCSDWVLNPHLYEK
jgi:hypothetical protein